MQRINRRKTETLVSASRVYGVVLDFVTSCGVSFPHFQVVILPFKLLLGYITCFLCRIYLARKRLLLYTVSI